MGDLSSWKGREPVVKHVMEGQYVRLEPFEAAKHGQGYFEAVTIGDGKERFRYLLETQPESFQELEDWLANAEASTDPLYWAVIDKRTGKVAGRQTFLRTDAKNGVTEIGHIYWGSAIARTPATTEALYLFARYTFDELDYRRFEWKCNNANEPSKKAALRYGFTAEGVHRQLMVVKGKNRDTAWFSMLDYEWPIAKQALETWLSADNFDSAGKQRRTLMEIRNALTSQS